MTVSTKYPLSPWLFAVLFFFFFPLLVSAATVQYGYDSLHRLISADYDNGVTFTYSYDELGNKLTHNSTGVTNTVYEDAEDGGIIGWEIYDNDPTGASINNVFDDQRASQVIEFVGDGTANGYRLRDAEGNDWDDTTYNTIEWSAQYSDHFTIYIAVQTKDGFRYLYYTPVDTDNLGTEQYIHHGLGSAARNGNWQTFFRNLSYDLKDAQPENELESVLAFLIRGSGRVDDIKTYAEIPANIDTDGDTLFDIDEMNIYGTNPYSSDTDDDGVDDDQELAYWGDDWNSDPDSDGLINILDQDADDDGFMDGTEIQQGTDPVNGSVYPTQTLYEDAEDGNISGWVVYDSDPAGAYINNIYDEQRAGRVIEFTGAGTANGYRLRNADGSTWDDTKFKILKWSMRYNEGFTFYIAVQTKDGFRYLYYTPADTDNLGTETYIHHGLGTHTVNGEWHTMVRDLEFDLKEAQPDNELESVLGFLIRGSGKVDDIATLATIPADQDSDGDTLFDLDEMTLYGTHPHSVDTDGDGVDDDHELTYWGEDWNSDPDNDGIINILDQDADNDGFLDGFEIQQGTGPANAASVPTIAVYEDAEDSSTLGWDIYDNDPTGASITNVIDDERQSRVIEFAGTGTGNGYRLRDINGSYWYDTNFKVLDWSMRYSETFTVYIAVQSKDGFRYLQYTPVTNSNLGSDTYIHHGLGTSVIDGAWHNLSRDLEADLKEAQPDNELEAILGFLIRGSGRVDDIEAKE